VASTGHSTTPRRSGTFKLTLEFSEDYPNKAPVVKFKSNMFHPNSKAISLAPLILLWCITCVLCSLRRRRHLPRYPPEPVESHLRCICYPNIDPGVLHLAIQAGQAPVLLCVCCGSLYYATRTQTHQPTLKLHGFTTTAGGTTVISRQLLHCIAVLKHVAVCHAGVL
jgi:hypothetical protein